MFIIFFDNSPNTFASNTFFESPIINLLTPFENVLNLFSRLSISVEIVSYLTIGPCNKCGNINKYVAYDNKLLELFTFSLYTSIK